MNTKTAHTYAILEISEAAYREIRGKLEEAGYAHAFHLRDDQGDGEVIDMHGIALRADPANPTGKSEALEAEVTRLTALLNTPEIHDFAKAVVLEAAHQRERWPEGHDVLKSDEDWFWLIGYLAGKALHTPIRKDFAHVQRYIEQHDTVEFGLSVSEVRAKQLHRIITIAAAAANWHAHVLAPGKE